ncbi:MAG: hypothetical protein C0417_11160 [Chlorobiaceae bacterium]|nr:hypothetical protein [Chlorobiaceae bacterium]
MNAKKIVTVVLLLFVIVSVVFLLAKEFTPKQVAIDSPKDESFITQGAVGDSSSRDTAVIDKNLAKVKITQNKNPQVEDRKIVVYYFHRTMRCATCIKLEEYSDEAIKSGFASQLKNGKLEWKIINIEDAGNEHFENDYKLYSQSLVLIELQNGKQKRWKNLEKIWELVGTKEVYLRYVQEEVKSYLEENT